MSSTEPGAGVGSYAGPPAVQTLLFTGTRLLGLVVGTVTTLLLIRLLSIEQFGLYAAGTGVFLLVASFGYLGADQLLLSRGITPQELRRFLPGLGAATLLVAALLAVAWPGLAATSRAVLVLLAATRLAEQLRSQWTLLPQLTGGHASRALRELAGASATGLAALAAVLWHPHALSAALGGLIGSVAFSTYAVTLGRGGGPDLHGLRDWREQVDIVRAGLGFASSAVVFSLINATGLALLPVFADEQTVAVFRAAILVYTAALVVPVAINNDVLRPHLYNVAHAGGGRHRIGARMVAFNLSMSVVVGAALYLFGQVAAAAVFGEGYAELARLAGPLALSMPFAFLGSYLSNVLITWGRLRSVVAVQITLLLVAVAANLLAAPAFGAVGAAYAVLVVDVVGLAAYAVLARHAHRAAG